MFFEQEVFKKHLLYRTVVRIIFKQTDVRLKELIMFKQFNHWLDHLIGTLVNHYPAFFSTPDEDYYYYLHHHQPSSFETKLTQGFALIDQPDLLAEMMPVPSKNRKVIPFNRANYG